MDEYPGREVGLQQENSWKIIHVISIRFPDSLLDFRLLYESPSLFWVEDWSLFFGKFFCVCDLEKTKDIWGLMSKVKTKSYVKNVYTESWVPQGHYQSKPDHYDSEYYSLHRKSFLLRYHPEMGGEDSWPGHPTSE